MKTARRQTPPSLNDIVLRASRSDIASLGTLVARIMEIIRNPNSNASELRKVIEIDPPLSAKMLRRANSAAYSVKRSISSIHEAIVILGFSSVRELAMSLKVSKTFQGGESGLASARRMTWKHSLSVALACKYLFRREFKDHGEAIYTAALLHDIGIIAEEQFAAEPFTTALELLASGQAASLAAAEKGIFGFNHAELGQALVLSWRMPEDLSGAIASHHSPLEAPQQHFRQAAAISACDFACRRQGVSIEPAAVSPEEQETQRLCLERLGVSEEALDLIITDVIAEVASLEARGELY